MRFDISRPLADKKTNNSISHDIDFILVSRDSDVEFVITRPRVTVLVLNKAPVGWSEERAGFFFHLLCGPTQMHKSRGTWMDRIESE